MASATLTLVQQPPQWDLPSKDPNCLAAHAYLRFSSMPFLVRNTTRTFLSSTGKLPLLEDSGKVYEEHTNIILHLKKLGLDLDDTLSPTQMAEEFAFINLVENTLFIAMNIELYDNGYRLLLNRGDFFKHYWKVDVLRSTITGLKDDNLMVRVKEIYFALSARLGTGPFFFGQKPSTLDAIVFGHLAVQLRAPGTSRLARLIHDFPNLVEYCHRILLQYWNVDCQFPIPPVPLRERIGSRLHIGGFGGWADSSKDETSNKVADDDPFAKEQRDKKNAQGFAVLLVFAVAGMFVFDNSSEFVPLNWIRSKLGYLN
eukprot:TRINITY_DN16573_c0_g1_i1.p1 TRINITY_DN16573_c0_g1~~TRINITY_DN16573_c0_g1_i1.p1  ORF type:complete len:314 (+),score=59.94 TRINITY_DN16573_c0_g1_i1:195-1136(+)